MRVTLLHHRCLPSDLFRLFFLHRDGAVVDPATCLAPSWLRRRWHSTSPYAIADTKLREFPFFHTLLSGELLKRGVLMLLSSVWFGVGECGTLGRFEGVSRGRSVCVGRCQRVWCHVVEIGGQRLRVWFWVVAMVCRKCCCLQRCTGQAWY